MRFWLIGCISLLFVGCAAARPLSSPDLPGRQTYVQSHPELSTEVRQAILEGRVTRGMTRDDVRASWGEPSKIDRFDTNPNEWWYEKDAETWHYKGAFLRFAGPDRYVSFKSGIVVEVQEAHWYSK